jgi:hypothetical protein
MTQVTQWRLAQPVTQPISIGKQLRTKALPVDNFSQPVDKPVDNFLANLSRIL